MGKAALGMADIALRNGERLINIVNDILDVAKSDAGKLELNIEKYNLHKVVSESIESNAPYLKKCECDLKLETTIDDPLFVNMDKGRIIQVMNNLISNI